MYNCASFLVSPKDLLSLCFSIALGLTYFSVIPATAGLVGKMFGPQFMATLFGFALFSHQIGGFLGAYLGGFFFSITGDYTTLFGAALAIFAALIHLPIKEKLVFGGHLVEYKLSIRIPSRWPFMNSETLLYYIIHKCLRDFGKSSSKFFDIISYPCSLIMVRRSRSLKNCATSQTKEISAIVK